MCKCCDCKNSFLIDEMVGYNCNGEEVSMEEEDLELNCQNPDYLVKARCLDCYENMEEERYE